MSSVSEFLRKQGYFLLENEIFSLFCVATLAFIPLVNWLSVGVVALITLRKGGKKALKVLVAGMLSILLLSWLSSETFAQGVMAAVSLFFPCYIMAIILRLTVDWRITADITVLFTVLIISLLYRFVPDLIQRQQDFIHILEQNPSFSDLLTNPNMPSREIIASYLIGIQGVSIVLSALTSLLLARSIQARLFYPEGYRQEILNFRASSWMLFFLGFAALGVYWSYPIAISSLPILVIYFASAGLSFLGYFLLHGKRKKRGVWLVLPLILIPFIFLPICIILGILDGLINFRSRWFMNADRSAK